jgi:hypothetical protein
MKQRILAGISNDNRGSGMKKNNLGAVTMAVGVGLLSLVANAEYSPIANLTEKWTNDANWKLSADSGVTNEFYGDSLGIKFKSRTGDNPLVTTQLKIGDVGADETASLPSGMFTGNYISSEISAVEFDVKRIGTISNATLSFASANENVWNRPFSLPAGTSDWVHVVIPLVFSPEWSRMGAISQTIFTQDLAAVVRIGVWAASAVPVEQVILLDNFKVVGPWELGPMTADKLPVYWLQEYAMTGEGAYGDKDKDGLLNIGEYLMGTDPGDPLSKFIVSIRRNQAGQKVLNWKHVNNRRFNILASDDLVATNSFVSITPDVIVSSGPTNEMILNEAGGGAVFYKVEIEQP